VPNGNRDSDANATEQSKNRGTTIFQLRMTGTTQAEMDNVTRLKSLQGQSVKGEHDRSAWLDLVTF
jgi:hypothetical protein